MPGSFNNYARKVRDPQQRLGSRISALKSCLTQLSWLTGITYQQTCACYTVHFGLDRLNLLTEAQLLAALAAMERDRNVYLEALRAFDRKRIRQKMRGQRHPRRADKEALAAVAKVISVTNGSQ